MILIVVGRLLVYFNCQRKRWNSFALDLVCFETDGDAEIDGLAAGMYVGVFNEMDAVGTGGNVYSDAFTGRRSSLARKWIHFAPSDRSCGR
jgi:hypothetical protein